MNDETIIQVEKGICDCCYEENIEINVCPSNNKCEYAMCNICIKNVKHLSEDKKRCPACREEIFSYKLIRYKSKIATAITNVQI